ncbi:MULTISPECIES: GNAT family N-acetyltransferase [unclassified Paenibacillus]|uniref:GNAT family N-acetyltransferase n=1 Tax=unclassified Paenibacillus TaxID=185978 RepID=UPI0036314E15
MNEIIIQKVNHLDTHKLILLVEESASEGFRHIKRLVNDYETGANKFDKEGEALFIAYQNNEIVGVCGLNRDPYVKSKEVGRVRWLYISPRVRRLGIGRTLMDSVITEARKKYKMLVLRTDNPIADVFYLSIGFSVKLDSENDSHLLQLDEIE